MRAHLALLVPLAFTPLPAGDDDRDVVELTRGAPLTGRVVIETDDGVVLAQGTSERKIPRRQIAAVRSVFRAQWTVLERFKASSGRSPDELLALADACRTARLDHDEKLFLWCILRVDPAHVAANERLGHKKSGKGWLVPGRGGDLPLERADTVRQDWGKAWELRSEHFTVRSSTTIADTVDTMLELEFFYHYAMQLWQKDLGLREVLVPMRVNLYGKAEEAPQLGSHVGAIFSHADNTVYIVAGGNGRRTEGLFHESMHNLIFNTVVGGNARTSRGPVPAWVNEGFAEYMEGVVTGGRRGAPDRVDANILTDEFMAVAKATDTYDLHRVLNFTSDDFVASSGQQVKYGQSYVLVHYLLHGEREKHRPLFLDYLRDAFSGKGQASTFRRIFAKDLKAIEKGHLAWARGA